MNYFSTVVVMLCLSLFAGIGCSDRGVDPGKGNRGHFAYFSTLGVKDIIYRLNTETTVVDSFDIELADIDDNHLGPLACSADGKLLYAVAKEGLLVFDTDDFDIHDLLPYRGGVTTSPTNDCICISTDQGSYFLSTVNHHVIFHDTTEIRPGRFSDDGDRFYGTRWDSTAA